MISLQSRFRGMLLGVAVGDAVGLPAEGVARARARKMFKGPWRHRLFLRRGMISDDTEHTIFVIQSLLAHSDNPGRFVQRLAFCLRWWLISLPAGVGLATGRAIFRLWLGFSPQKSGVYSAGNGPAMRAAPLGAFFADEPDKLNEFAQLCTRITHTDPKAATGAKAIALTAAWIRRENIEQQPALPGFVRLLSSAGKDPEWTNLVGEIEDGCKKELSVEAFADKLGQSSGVSGYIYHSAPVVLFAWYRHCGDFEKTLTSVWNCGGDTDTTGAMAGGLAGLTVGEAGMPAEWIEGIAQWPRSIVKMREMADALARKACGEEVSSPVKYFWPGVAVRNAVFLAIVLLHGFRRLFPPY